MRVPFVALLGLSLASAPMIVVARAQAAPAAKPATSLCPAQLSPGFKFAAGARLLGHVPSGGARLDKAALFSGRPGDQSEDGLTEAEQDDESSAAGITTYLYGYKTSAAEPMGVLCRYGLPDPTYPATLLLPLRDGTQGRCRFRIADMPKQRLAHPPVMACTGQ